MIEMVFFGPRAEEIIGCPADTLIGNAHGSGTYIPTRITALYGKYYELRVSVSSMSFQRNDITYQVDSIVGIPVITAPTDNQHQNGKQTITIDS